MIEDIVGDVLKKLLRTPSKDFENFVGIEDHIAKMSVYLHMKSKEVRMVGIWGPSGIGKTSIARALYERLCPRFKNAVFIDRGFISMCTEDYKKSRSYDYNLKLHLQEKFLSKILNQEGIKINHLGVVGERLKHKEVLIFIDDLDDQVVLEALVGGNQWFGPGSRIVVITKDKHLLEIHGINLNLIYNVQFPSEKQAREMFSRAALEKNYPPDDLVELASGFVAGAGGLPLALMILGKSVKGKDKKMWTETLSRLQDGLTRDIEAALRVSYDELDSKKDKAIFRHIASFFNGWKYSSIELLLGHLDPHLGLKNLVDKSLISVVPSWNNTNIVEMHCLVQVMGKTIVREQSEEPGEREFVMNLDDVRDVLSDNTGSKKVIGILLDIDETDELCIRKEAFKGMRNLRFLWFYKKSWLQEKEVKWDLPERFDHFPRQLRLLSWPGYPMKDMPYEFCPRYLVELRMTNMKLLKKLWEGVQPLTFLKDMDLSESKYLEEIPDLSEATNLETLNIHGCSSLVELPSSIRNLNKLTDLNMAGCTNMETLPVGINLKSLLRVNFHGCSKLRNYHHISDQITSLNLNKTAMQVFPSSFHLENLTELHMEQTMSARLWEGVQSLGSLKTVVLSGSKNLKELPDLSTATRLQTLNLKDCSSLENLTLSSIQNLHKLTSLEMTGCSSLVTLPAGINLESLYRLNLDGCSLLSSFPDISNNISILNLNKTAIEEVPPRIKYFSKLHTLEMWECKYLKSISPKLFKLKNLNEVTFSDCKQLTEVKWPEDKEGNSYTRDKLALINFSNCFNDLNQETFIRQSTTKYLILPGVKVPEYFTHRSTGNFLTVPLHRSSVNRQSSLDFKACILVSEETIDHPLWFIYITVQCRYKDWQGNSIESTKTIPFSSHQYHNHLGIFDCHFPLSHDCHQVEIEFRVSSIRLKLQGCGIKLTQNETASDGESWEEDDDDEGYVTVREEECSGDDDEGYVTALEEE